MKRTLLILLGISLVFILPSFSFGKAGPKTGGGDNLPSSDVQKGTPEKNVPPTTPEGVRPPAKDRPKIAVWDLTSGDIKGGYAQDLTLILASEVSKLGKFEVYSQENVRTLAGWTSERMQLGCTETKCLTALGQMDIAKLISGRVGKIGNTFSISLSLFDTQNAKSEKLVSEFCKSEDELISLVQGAVRKLLEEGGPPPAAGPQTAAVPNQSGPEASLKTPVSGLKESKFYLGMTVQEITPEIAQQQRLANPSGVIVTQVDPGSLAARGGVKRGDVIRQINAENIRKLADYEAVLGRVKNGDILRFMLTREDRNLIVMMKASLKEE